MIVKNPKFEISAVSQKQYPNKGTKLNLGSKIFLLTNSSEYKMPNINGWSRNDINAFANLINLNVKYTGNGYAEKYNIEKNTLIDLKSTLEVELKPKYQEKTKEIEKEDKKDEKRTSA